MYIEITIKKFFVYIGIGALTHLLCYTIGFYSAKKKGLQMKCDWCTDNSSKLDQGFSVV